MSDFERIMQDSLKAVGEQYRPDDVVAAKERFLRRRRRRRIGYSVGGLALAGAAGVAALFVLSQEAPLTEDTPKPPVVAAPARWEGEVIEEPLGDGAIAVAYGEDGYVYAVASRDARLLKIDPASHEVVDAVPVATEPDDVVVSSRGAWLADPPTGSVIYVPFEGGRLGAPAEPLEVGPPGTHLDLALAGRTLWVAGKSTTPTRELFIPGWGIEVRTDATDVAVDDSAVWLLDSHTGVLQRVAATTGRTDSFRVPIASENADLAVGDGSVWIADGSGARLLQIDPDRGTVTGTEQLDPTRSSIALGPGSVWVVSSADAAGGALRRIDPGSGRAIGEPLKLRGWPTDIVFGAGSLWLVNYDRDSLLEIRPTDVPEQAPQDGTEHEPILFYSARGDIWAAADEGAVRRVIATPELELRPSLSRDLSRLAYQRGQDADANVVERNESDDESIVGAGTWPSFGPDDRLAYFVPEDGGDAASIVITSQGAPETTLRMPPGDYRHLVWDEGGDTLYYEAAGTIAQHFIDEAAAPNHIAPEEEGAAYAAPTNADGDSIDVLKVCCTNDTVEPSAVEIGRIGFSTGEPRYETLVPLDLTFDPKSDEFFLAGWDDRKSGLSSWWVSDGATLHRVTYDPSGEPTEGFAFEDVGDIDGIAPVAFPWTGGIRFEL